MTTGKMLLCFLGILAGLAALAVFVAWVEKKRPNEEYDERQKLIRGKAYRFGFYVGLVFYIAAFAYLESGQELPMKTSTVLFLGLLIQLLAFHIYCLVENAALPLGDKGWLMVASYSIICVSNLINYRNQVKYTEVYWQYIKLEPDSTLPVPDGTDSWLCLLLGITGGALAVMYLIRLLWKEKD